MKSSLLYLAALALGTNNLGVLAAACNQDNCYRAMFPTSDPARLSTAEAFCATYTRVTSTATTGFIPRFTTACGSAPAKYSSACSCAPKTTTSSSIITSPTTGSSTCVGTPYEVWQNGDFECGLYPWRALVAVGTTYAIQGPGYTGANAFVVTQAAALDGVGLGEATLSQLIYITSGTLYTFSFRSFWSAGNGGFIGIKLNGQPQFTVDANDGGGPGIWNLNTFTFTATGGQYLIEFEFLFASSSAVAKIDTITLTPGT